ncbi:VWA domain-containing protein [Streptomyces phaeoluteigriseus]|uniref:VWA domain-containing protein n=1 Tax=Streptomyces phaeoluteigriseus TaxID=114686 RepID=A0ABY4Z897_9ACTN|nr:VWA domain-containing protein [Streptomyces phaeoluteigriseus]USQ85274.1 VWA domain-containing protein [Streptomyces phaeoluteigriseus]
MNPGRPANEDAHGMSAAGGGARRSASVGLDISQWKYLSGEAREPQMHAIVTVRADGTENGGAASPVLAQVLAVDCSSSMGYPQEKLRAAHQAAVAALRMLPDGTPFAVVRGADSASVVYPATETMVRADARHRAEAERAVHRLIAGGGTCIGSWLDLSRRLLAEADAPIGHVLLLTDGKNEHDELMPLSDVLEACAGRFVCDAWGIGDGWDGRELLGVTSRLHGRASSVREEAALAREYEQLMRRLLAKSIPELVISVTPMAGAEVRYLKQVFPTEVELDPVGTGGEATRRFVTRAWGDETRRYQLCLSADPVGRPRGEDLQLAVVSLDVPGGEAVEVTPPLPCLVHWTDDDALSGHSDIHVEHFEQHQRLGEAVAAATDAHRNGERDLAQRHLGTAVRLAHAIGADQSLGRLEQLVEIDDPAAGRVRLRPGVAAVDFEHLITASSHSTYGPASGSADTMIGGGPDAATARCSACDGRVPAAARFCPLCGHGLSGRP